MPCSPRRNCRSNNRCGDRNTPAPPAVCPNFDKQLELIKQMRLVWSQHVNWTRMVIISIVAKLKDEKDTAARLLQNPNDLAEIYSKYYPPDVAKLISHLVTEHLQIGAALITAIRDGKTAEAEALDRQWYINADQMADAFAGINPYYDREEIQKMFYHHLDLIKQQVKMRLAGNYPADIAAADKNEREMLGLADMLASGIMRQFPERF